MKIDTDTRTIVLEPRACRSCQYSPGTEATPIPCPTCSGTGNGPRGGKGQCRKCYGNGRAWDQENRRPCSKCGGDWAGKDLDGICDNIPTESWKDLVRWTVVRATDKEIGRIAGLIGVRGAIVTCTDYGRTAELADDEAVLSEAMRAIGSSVQAISIARNDGHRIADEIRIVVTSNGYAVLPSWDEVAA